MLGNLEKEVKREIEEVFEEKKRKLGVEAGLEVMFIDHAPIDGAFVYGEAFPFEAPPRIRLEVVALYATTEELTEVICDELIHIKYPELEQYIPGTLQEREEFREKIRALSSS